MFTFRTHCGENKLWQQQNIVLPFTRIDFAALVSSRAVRISSRAVRVFPALLVGSLSKGVFERRTATGNETFSVFTRLGATTFVKQCVFTLIETIYLKIRAHPLCKNEKRPLPVAARRSKTPLLKLPSTTSTRTTLIRDLFSYGFARKLRAEPYGSYDNLGYYIMSNGCSGRFAKHSRS